MGGASGERTWGMQQAASPHECRSVVAVVCSCCLRGESVRWIYSNSLTGCVVEVEVPLRFRVCSWLFFLSLREVRGLEMLVILSGRVKDRAESGQEQTRRHQRGGGK